MKHSTRFLLLNIVFTLPTLSWLLYFNCLYNNFILDCEILIKQLVLDTWFLVEYKFTLKYWPEDVYHNVIMCTLFLHFFNFHEFPLLGAATPASAHPKLFVNFLNYEIKLEAKTKSKRNNI